MEIKKAIHINEVCRRMDVARIYRQQVNITAWESSGDIVEYKGWRVRSSNWVKGYVRLVNPKNNEIRTVPEVFIIKFNGQNMYL